MIFMSACGLWCTLLFNIDTPPPASLRSFFTFERSMCACMWGGGLQQHENGKERGNVKEGVAGHHVRGKTL